MKKTLKLSLLFLTITLFACGGGSSGGGSNAPAPQPTAPDLVVSSFTANPTTISSGGTVSLSATITNSGNLAADSIVLRYHRSPNNNISDSGTPIATDDISNLSANSSSDATADVMGHSSGIYYYWACVVSSETTRTNNCSDAKAITGPQPDISVSSFSASPTIISSDRKVNLAFTITNSGNATADSITLRYHRSQSDNTSDSGTPIATDDISRILAGGSNNVTADVTRHSSGIMYYWVCVTVADETTTDNNCSNNAIAITIGVPDLAVVDFTANSSTTTTDINSGGVVNLSAKVRNSGTFTANSTTLRFYRSQNNSINDSANNLATTDSISISSLSANSSSDATVDVTGHGSGIYYYWACVVAVSGESDITNNCSDFVAVTAIVGAAWTQAKPNDNVGWSARSSYTSIVFKNTIWVLGGYDDSNKNDVWSSLDGTSWTQATDDAGWTARNSHTSVVFKNTIWVLGGYDGFNKNDVWSSSNGTSWTQATDDAGWAARCCHSSTVFDNKIWVLGGTDGSRKNDVWSSVDGINWIQATSDAGWTAREWHSSVVFDNKIWVLGGLSLSSSRENDVWSSVDGITWKQATSDAGWTARSAHTSIVFDNKMWVLGGESPGRHNDVWSSVDGTSWSKAIESAGWSDRHRHASIVFDNKIWVLGGSISGTTVRKNDVWSSGINNNSFDSATSFNAGSELLSSHSAILTAGASDYYQISLTAGNWTFATDGISTDCELYDSSQTSLFQDNNGGVCSITQTITTAGDYYIVVKSFNSSTGNYTLKITTPTD